MLPGKSLGIGDILAMVRRRILLLILPPVVTVFVALVYSASLPDVFQSSVLIAIVPQRVPDQFVQSTVTLKTADRIEALTTQVTSRTVLEQLILEFDLYPEARRRLPMEDVIAIMRPAVQTPLEPLRRGPRGPEPPHAFTVHFQYPDPILATKVVSRLASMFVDQNTRDRGALAEATNQFLEQQLAQVRTRLEEQEAKLEEFRQRHGKELPTQLSSNMQMIQSAQVQIQSLVEAIARDSDRKLMLERLYNEAVQDPTPVIATAAAAAGRQQPNETPLGGTATEQLATAREVLARLELRLKPDHPDVGRARRTIADLEVKATAEADAIAAGGTPATPAATNPLEVQRRERLRTQRAELESLDRQTAFKEAEVKRLRSVMAEYQRRIEAVPGVESQWAQLSRDYDTLQESYQAMLNKSEAAKVAADLENRRIGEQFRILDEAKVPQRPISPVRAQISGIGLGIGLALGVLIAAFLELKDRSFRTAADVLDVLRLPVLATVPLVMTAEERSRRLRKRLLASGLGAGIAAAAGYAFWTMRLWTQLI